MTPENSSGQEEYSSTAIIILVMVDFFHWLFEPKHLRQKQQQQQQ